MREAFDPGRNRRSPSHQRGAGKVAGGVGSRRLVAHSASAEPAPLANIRALPESEIRICAITLERQKRHLAHAPKSNLDERNFAHPVATGYPAAMDTLTPQQRSERMSRVRGRNTKPELVVRRIAHGLGYRFRLHRRELPGAPDLVFPSRRKVIFVHGCFWHRHPDPACKLARMPKSRLDFWVTKLENNRNRDEQNVVRLHDLGWETLVIWECQIRDRESLRVRIREFLK